MAKHYTYTDTRKGCTIFETVQPNYVSIEDVDKMVLQETGSDPRINPVTIGRAIRMVSDNFRLQKKRKNKKR